VALAHDRLAAPRYHCQRTPTGAGVAQRRFLPYGDTVEVEIDKLGTLTNPVRGE
jgi:fumarylacetoacetate (FAA) hydrolase family protein